MLTYQATTEHYDASDGVSLDVGDLDLRNILVVSDDGEDGNLIMTVVNNGDDDVELDVQFGEAAATTQTIEIEAGDTVAFGVDDVESEEELEPLLLEGIDTQPGGLLDHVLPVRRRRGHREAGARARRAPARVRRPGPVRPAAAMPRHPLARADAADGIRSRSGCRPQASKR